MEWFSQNWVWVVFFAAFIAMHLFGHGGPIRSFDIVPFSFAPLFVRCPIFNCVPVVWATAQIRIT